jgi:hypothetical protein
LSREYLKPNKGSPPLLVGRVKAIAIDVEDVWVILLIVGVLGTVAGVNDMILVEGLARFD